MVMLTEEGRRGGGEGAYFSDVVPSVEQDK
jgi:hypothetical protein